MSMVHSLRIRGNRDWNIHQYFSTTFNRLNDDTLRFFINEQLQRTSVSSFEKATKMYDDFRNEKTAQLVQSIKVNLSMLLEYQGDYLMHMDRASITYYVEKYAIDVVDHIVNRVSHFSTELTRIRNFIKYIQDYSWVIRSYDMCLEPILIGWPIEELITQYFRVCLVQFRETYKLNKYIVGEMYKMFQLKNGHERFAEMSEKINNEKEEERKGARRIEDTIQEMPHLLRRVNSLALARGLLRQKLPEIRGWMNDVFGRQYEQLFWMWAI